MTKTKYTHTTSITTDYALDKFDMQDVS